MSHKTNFYEAYIFNQEQCPGDAKPLPTDKTAVNLVARISKINRLSDLHAQAHEACKQYAIWLAKKESHQQIDMMKYWLEAYVKVLQLISEETEISFL